MQSILGYLRPDIREKNIQLQLDLLIASGVNKIYQEKPSATKRNTPQLSKLLAEAQAGDTLVVTSLDRIALNTKHLLEIVESLSSAGVTFKVINNGIDTSTSHGEVLSLLLGAIVEFEQKVMRERQSVGIAKARLEGRYKGRKPTAREKTDEVLALNKHGLTRQKIADELGIGVASVYRILKTHTVTKKPLRKIAKNPKNIPVGKQKRVERKSTREADAEQLSFF